MTEFKRSTGKAKKTWGRGTDNNGLPFPNFALGKTEIPAVCRCIYDGTNFYVTHHLDMHTLHYNGSFGTSSLTFRGLSYNDTSFSQRFYFKKKLLRQAMGEGTTFNGSIKSDDKVPLNCFKAGKGKRVRVDVESSSTGPELLVHLSSEVKSNNNSFPNSPVLSPPTNASTSTCDDSVDSNPTRFNSSATSNCFDMNEDYASDTSDDGGGGGGADGGAASNESKNGPISHSDQDKRIPKLDIDAHMLEEEKLILMPEEAIFLSFGVGCLAIYNMQGQAVDYRQCWRNLVSVDSEFPTQYAAYHYFRGKNWIPKNGGNYGASYVLYEAGPSVKHSTYIVHILDNKKPRPTWMELAAWQRLATHVSKQVLLCEVSLPEAFRPEVSEPRSVFDMKLRELSLARWNPTAQPS